MPYMGISKTILALLGSTLLLASCGKTKQQKLEEELRFSRIREKTLMRTVDSLNNALFLMSDTAIAPGTNSLVNGTQLKQKGIPSAEYALEHYLNAKQADVIPFEGMMGKPMHFEKAVPLADQFAFATVSDGQVNGFLLLKYDANDNGFSWQPVYEWRNW